MFPISGRKPKTNSLAGCLDCNPWVDSACADCLGFLVLGAIYSHPRFHLRLGASDFCPDLAFCFTGPFLGSLTPSPDSQKLSPTYRKGRHMESLGSKSPRQPKCLQNKETKKTAIGLRLYLLHLQMLCLLDLRTLPRATGVSPSGPEIPKKSEKKVSRGLWPSGPKKSGKSLEKVRKVWEKS